jgi:hypothetical protein
MIKQITTLAFVAARLLPCNSKKEKKKETVGSHFVARFVRVFVGNVDKIFRTKPECLKENRLKK